MGRHTCVLCGCGWKVLSVCMYMCDSLFVFVAVVVVVLGGMCLCGGGLLAELPACVF